MSQVGLYEGIFQYYGTHGYYNSLIKKVRVSPICIEVHMGIPDGIPGNLLKICANEIADVLTLLFQSSLDQRSLPSD